QALLEDLAGLVESRLALDRAGEPLVDIGLARVQLQRSAEVLRGPLAVAELAVSPSPQVRPIVPRRQLDHRVDDLIGLVLLAQLVAEQDRLCIRGIEPLRGPLLDVLDR